MSPQLVHLDSLFDILFGCSRVIESLDESFRKLLVVHLHEVVQQVRLVLLLLDRFIQCFKNLSRVLFVMFDD